MTDKKTANGKILDSYFSEFVDKANNCSAECGNPDLTTKCMALSLARYGTYAVMEGKYLDPQTEQMISDRILMTLYTAIGEAMDTISNVDGAQILDAKKQVH